MSFYTLTCVPVEDGCAFGVVQRSLRERAGAANDYDVPRILNLVDEAARECWRVRQYARDMARAYVHGSMPRAAATGPQS